jgi:hypothetical protein
MPNYSALCVTSIVIQEAKKDVLVKSYTLMKLATIKVLLRSKNPACGDAPSPQDHEKQAKDEEEEAEELEKEGNILEPHRTKHYVSQGEEEH